MERAEAGRCFHRSPRSSGAAVAKVGAAVTKTIGAVVAIAVRSPDAARVVVRDRLGQLAPLRGEGKDGGELLDRRTEAKGVGNVGQGQLHTSDAVAAGVLRRDVVHLLEHLAPHNSVRGRRRCWGVGDIAVAAPGEGWG